MIGVKRQTSTTSNVPLFRTIRFMKSAVGCMKLSLPHELTQPKLDWAVQGVISSRRGCLLSRATPGNSASCQQERDVLVVPVLFTVIHCYSCQSTSYLSGIVSHIHSPARSEKLRSFRRIHLFHRQRSFQPNNTLLCVASHFSPPSHKKQTVLWRVLSSSWVFLIFSGLL